MARIGFIGLGNMGMPMAANLVKAGHEVTGFDLAPPARDNAAKAGVTFAASAREAAAECDAVVTMLPAGKDVIGLYSGANGILSAADEGTLFIDCSTIDVASARAAHQAAREAGMAAVDAPVSGGVGGAAAGTLTFMVGGEAIEFSRAKPLLEAMGKRIVHCGEAGNGQVAKICNNMILGISMIGVSEAFVLGEKLGLTNAALYEVASAASGQCWSLTSYCPVPGPVPASPANNGYRPGFAAELMLKDLKLAVEAGHASGAAIDLGSHAADLYTAFVNAGGKGVDFSGIVRAIRERSGDTKV